MDSAPPEEVFRYCLENPDHLSEEQLLDKFPQHREGVLALLRLDIRLSLTLPGQMPDATYDPILQRVLKAAEANRNVDTSSYTGSPQLQPVKVIRQVRAPLALWLRRSSWAFALFAVLIGTVWFLAAQALPDSPVYGVKLATEDLLLNATSESSSLVRGNISIANSRLSDMKAMNNAGKLAAAGPSFDNYSHHLKSGIAIWKTLQQGVHTDLDKLLYTSSVAGQRTFQGFENLIGSLPLSIRTQINEALVDLGELNSESIQHLKDAGVDLDQVLRDADRGLAVLLTPAATVTPVIVPTSIASTQVPGTPDEGGVSKAALDVAHAIISQGGSSSTPIVAAAETVIAGAAGTPLAQAQKTVLSGWPSATPAFTPIVIPFASPTATMPRR